MAQRPVRTPSVPDVSPGVEVSRVDSDLLSPLSLSYDSELPPLPESLSRLSLYDVPPRTKPEPARRHSPKPTELVGSPKQIRQSPTPSEHSDKRPTEKPPVPPRKPSSVDLKLAHLRNEMASLRQMDLQLLSQLRQLNDSISSYRQELIMNMDSYLNTSILGSFIHFERPYWTGNGTAPQSKSFLEPEKISETTVVFHMVVLVCAGCGILTSIVLLIGIYFDLRVLFVPWIFAMILATTVDVAHSIYLYGLDTVEFNPPTAILYTIDFFLLILNLYAVLCVISQYQELMAGRGTARFEQTLKISPVRYTCQPTGTSCLSSRRPATLPASPTQSPTKTTVTATTGSVVLVVGGGSSRRGSRKHVQFPDFDVPNLKSTDLLHANWKQGSSPPPEQSTATTTGYTPSELSSQQLLIADNRSSHLQAELLQISSQDCPKKFTAADL